MELAESPRGRNATATVRVIRVGRVVALIEYRRSGGVWLQDHYEACESSRPASGDLLSTWWVNSAGCRQDDTRSTARQPRRRGPLLRPVVTYLM